jgi:predicted RNA-binding Zn ribbon-like protein
MHLSQARFGWIGEALCLDFVNTVGNHLGEEVSEKLSNWADFLKWVREAQFLGMAEVREFEHRFAAQPFLGERLVATAVQFREAVYRILLAKIREESAGKMDLEILNDMLTRSPVILRVESLKDRFECTRQSSTLDEARLFGPIAWSAAELLTSEKLALVRQCADATCGWLFLDLTKNHSRRWCDMGDCGSRAKAQRYYQRKKQAAHSLRES